MTAVGEQTKSIEELVAYVINHRIRIDALAIFNERVASPTEIAGVLGENVSKVGHHVKELHDAGCIELVDTKQRRGAIEHFYRATVRPQITDGEWRAMPDENRREIVALVFQAVVAEGLSSLRARKMDGDDDLHLSWRVLNLDNEGRRELAAEQAESLSRIAGVEARSNARLVESGKDGISTVVAMMGFKRSRAGRPLGDRVSPAND
jgi:predicted transcriptional regulator